MLKSLSFEDFSHRYQQNHLDFGLGNVKILARKREYTLDEKFPFDPRIDNDTIGQLV